MMIEVLTDDATLREGVETYLLNLHTTLWQLWDVVDNGEREEAVDWVVKLLHDLEQVQL